VVSITATAGVTLRDALTLMVRGAAPTLAVVNDGGALVGKLSPADVRALLGGVVAAAAAGDGAAVDDALDAALAVGLGEWLTGQGVTTTARSSAPATGAPPPATDGAALKALPAGVSVAANALTVAPSTRLAALVDALVATGQHHAFVLAEEGGGVARVVSLTDLLATVAAAGGL